LAWKPLSQAVMRHFLGRLSVEDFFWNRFKIRYRMLVMIPNLYFTMLAGT
jgi:hypothetical protein